MNEDMTDVDVRDVLNRIAGAKNAMAEADSARLGYTRERQELANRANGYRTQAERTNDQALRDEVAALDARCAVLDGKVREASAEKQKWYEEIARLSAICLPERGMLALAAEKYRDARSAFQALESQRRDLSESRGRAVEAKREAVAGVSHAEGEKRNALSLGDVAAANAALEKAREADAVADALISNIDSRLHSLPDALEKARFQLLLDEAALWSAYFDALASEVLSHDAMPQLVPLIARAHAALLKTGAGFSLEQCIARIITKGYGAETPPEQVTQLQAEMAMEIGVA